ncbi:alpha/beta hydrolase [Sinomicrobium kalidii]|uniref:alpha/beta hydrolase n=1 Tax=Sinomicrobium kalidii TaxID=2900738 RepID=UPI001E2CFE67|nr:alpha/beta hydrolase [Sinomicrobium kalidii]UGU16637.1 alpha/beta hydrolase [Sinomicrobium kalidii]
MEKKGNDSGYRQTIEIPRSIQYTGKFLQLLSPALATKFATRLFTSPLKYKIPKREEHMDEQSKQTRKAVASIDKEIVVYEYGDSPKKILLVHGWSGRGTQLVKIADALCKAGYATISFDAPAHGKAGGKDSNMLEFIEAAMLLEKEYGPFEAAVGHSLGGMTLLNAVKKKSDIRKLVIIGSGDMVSDIALDFVRTLGLKDEISYSMKSAFDRQMGFDIDDLSASIAARDVHTPVLIVHDEDDRDVPVSAAKHILENLSDGELMITTGLGHRKILGDTRVIQKIITFIKN